jgi:hypothetical protein
MGYASLRRKTGPSANGRGGNWQGELKPAPSMLEHEAEIEAERSSQSLQVCTDGEGVPGAPMGW